MTEAQLLKTLQQWASELGSQKALAERLGISEPYLAQILNGTRKPGTMLLDTLQLEKVITYRNKTKETGDNGNEV